MKNLVIKYPLILKMHLFSKHLLGMLGSEDIKMNEILPLS